MKKPLIIIIRKETAKKILNSIPANSSITIKAGDADKILDVGKKNRG